jgi:DNA-binding response OmpR family regulator
MSLRPERDSGQTIFVVEDDPDVSLLIRTNLQNAGFRTEPFSNVMSALARAKVEPPALFLLDIMMPGEDGLDFCVRLRSLPQFAATPIIFVTARTSEDDRLQGFECGGDDYITKPFSPRELVARVKAALRDRQRESDVVKIGDLEIDRAAMCLRVRGEVKPTTTVEFRIIEAFALAPGRVFSRDRILRIAGSNAAEVDSRTVDVFISRIRAKIEDDPRSPVYLQTVRGAGYRLVLPSNLPARRLA